jgi:hypothetical protein
MQNFYLNLKVSLTRNENYSKNLEVKIINVLGAYQSIS